MTLILQGTDNSVSSPAVQGGTAGTTTGVYYPASNQLALATNGTRAVLIDSAQNFGLQIATSTWESGASAYQQNIGGAGGTSGNSFNMWGRSDSLRMWTNAYFDGGTYVRQVANSVVPTNITLDSTGGIGIQSAPSGAAGSTFVTGNITQFFALKKDSTLTLQGGTQSTGTGIAFPATQSASSDANTLDDYEEGTWTPALSGATFTYGQAVGLYVKVGKLVHASCFLTIASITGASATTVNITGLPFTSASSNASYGLQAVNLDNLTSNLNGTGAQIAPNGTQATLLANLGSTGSHVGLSSNQMTTASQVRINAVYEASS
jgi:hypothetical protein